MWLKSANKFLVKIKRDSVCMGDDVSAPHYYTFKISAKATLNDIFKHLTKRKYLALIDGKNHSWEGIVNNQLVTVVLGNNQSPKRSPLLDSKVSNYAQNGEINVHFKYNSSTT